MMNKVVLEKGLWGPMRRVRGGMYDGEERKRKGQRGRYNLWVSLCRGHHCRSSRNTLSWQQCAANSAAAAGRKWPASLHGTLISVSQESTEQVKRSLGAYRIGPGLLH